MGATADTVRLFGEFGNKLVVTGLVAIDEIEVPLELVAVIVNV